jgi:DNA uptake protein ComE-like DNA-binding protein
MLQPNWKVLFIFSNKEMKGIIVLGVLLFGSVLIRFLFPQHATKPDALIEAKNSTPVLHLVDFDPNTIDSVQAIYIGLPIKQVNNLLRYRAKGGYFKTAESFSKLYGLSPSIYNALAPYIKIGIDKRIGGGAFVDNHFQKLNGDQQASAMWKIDLNVANESEWEQKTGLPVYLIQRIMAYKQYRGAFTKPSELSKVYGLSDSVYQSLREHLEVRKQTSIQLNAGAMQFNDWKALGMFTAPQIWTILKLKRSSQGKLYWSNMVETLDLTQEEAMLVKSKVRFDN